LRISIWKKPCCCRALNRKAPSRPAAPHKPLFLAMGVWAMLVPWVWVWPELVEDPAFWHAHELIFGMAGAALGGYLLIALPSWTGPNHRQRVGHLSLVLLLLAWGLGRATMLSGAQGLVLWGSVVLYPLGLAALMLPPLWRARAWQKLTLGAVPVALAMADVAWLATRGVEGRPIGLALVLGFALLLSVVGGRALPAFFNSRFAAGGQPVLPLRSIGALASGAIALSLGAVIAQRPEMAGAALLLAGALQGLRLMVWGRWGVIANFDMLMLYLAWGWLVLGLLLLGSAQWMGDAGTPATMLHGLTLGAMGSMIMAVTARAFMVRAPGRLLASPAHAAAIVLISAAAVLRLAFPAAEAMGLTGLDWSVLIWSLGWACYLLPLLRGLIQPSPHPVLGAKRLRT
jgi:uncharacterized protein involved in response to NO